MSRYSPTLDQRDPNNVDTYNFDFRRGLAVACLPGRFDRVADRHRYEFPDPKDGWHADAWRRVYNLEQQAAVMGLPEFADAVARLTQRRALRELYAHRLPALVSPTVDAAAVDA